MADQGQRAAPPQPAHPEPHALWLWASAFGAVVLSVYVATLYPGISGGDAGELVVTTCNFGVAHPPGYPTFTLLGALFGRLVGVGPWAWRINLLSAVQGAAAAALVFAAAARAACPQPGYHWAGVASASLFAFSPTVWWYSLQGEVFALNNLLLAWLAYLAVRFFHYDQKPSLNVAYMGAFVCGLALTNQHTSVFYVAAAVLTVVGALWRHGLLRAASVALLTLSMVAGLSLYAYLPLAALRRPMDSWGDQRTLSGFMHHFLRREYGTFQLAADSDSDPGMLVRLGVYWRVLLEESLLVGPALALVGAGALALERKLRGVALILVPGWLSYMLVFHYLANLDPNRPLFLGVQARFWQQANLYVFLAAGLGMVRLLGWLCAFVARFFAAAGAPAVKRVLAALVCVTLGVAQLVRHYDSRNFAQTRVFRGEGEAILHSMPDGAIVLLNGDLNNNVVKYPQQCEAVRPDLSLVSLQLMSWPWFVPMQRDNYPNVTFPSTRYHPYEPGGFALSHFLDTNLPRRPVFLCGPFKYGDNSHEGAYETLPFGMCEQLVRKGWRPSDWTEFLRHSWRALPTDEALGPYLERRYTPDSWEHVAFHDVWERRRYLASYIAVAANKNLTDARLLEVAKTAYDELMAHRELLARRGLLQPQDVRDAGIVFGQWSRVLHQRGQERQQRRYERAMLRQWRRYVDLKPDDESIAVYVRERLNPYLNSRVEEQGAIDT